MIWIKFQITFTAWKGLICGKLVYASFIVITLLHKVRLWTVMQGQATQNKKFADGSMNASPHKSLLRVPRNPYDIKILKETLEN